MCPKKSKQLAVPFKVSRTSSGNLPVYTRFKANGKRGTTIVRNIRGDIQAIKKEIMTVCEAPVRERVGSLEVKGIHAMKLKQWLLSLRC